MRTSRLRRRARISASCIDGWEARRCRHYGIFPSSCGGCLFFFFFLFPVYYSSLVNKEAARNGEGYRETVIFFGWGL